MKRKFKTLCITTLLAALFFLENTNAVSQVPGKKINIPLKEDGVINLVSFSGIQPFEAVPSDIRTKLLAEFGCTEKEFVKTYVMYNFKKNLTPFMIISRKADYPKFEKVINQYSYITVLSLFDYRGIWIFRWEKYYMK